MSPQVGSVVNEGFMVPNEVTCGSVSGKSLARPLELVMLEPTPP
jgi:hypothetical protein